MKRYIVSSKEPRTRSDFENEIRRRLDQFPNQITVRREQEQEMKDILQRMGISFKIDDFSSPKGNLVFKLSYGKY